MPVPKGYRHSPEARAAISASMSKCWQEGRRQWQKDTPNRYQKLDAQQRLRRRMLDALGGKCLRCGFDDWRALQIDHVNGDGRSDRDRVGNRNRYFKAVVSSPDRYQLLCANCNWIKRYEQQEHGQQRSGELTEAMVVQAEVDAKASDNAEALAFSCRTED